MQPAQKKKKMALSVLEGGKNLHSVIQVCPKESKDVQSLTFSTLTDQSLSERSLCIWTLEMDIKID